MHTLLTLVRALHFASVFTLAGGLAFIALVAEPADAAAFRRRIVGLAWLGLGVGAVSGALWLLLEAQSMSGQSFAAAMAPDILGTVLTRTHFGRVWELRGALALPLILCLALAARRRWALWLALLLAAAELATLAGAGHAAAGEGWPGTVQLVGDAMHLLAAGAWVGGLLPLALLLAAARGDPQAAWQATRRFSVLGIIAVLLILATGILNSLFLVGTVPALLGTPYGQLLMIKVALFLTMVAFAAVNRLWLTPLLASGGAGALRLLQRNALIEAALGGAVLLVLGALGTLPPALHVEPRWPLPFSLSLAVLEADPRPRLEALAAFAAALAGLALAAYALRRPRQRSLMLLAGLFVFFATAWWPLQFMIVTAYPTSFAQSPARFTASSIERGAKLYAANCVACHGAGGRGDGPLAAGLPVAPADLTAAHIFGHRDGDLFWWIGNGIPAGGMPGFAAAIDAPGRWDLINFIHARAAALQPAVLAPQVSAVPAPEAPDFSFERGKEQSTLRQMLAQGPVLLVLYRLPGSAPRLQQLAAAEHALNQAGLRLLALPIDGQATEGESARALPDFAVRVAAAVPAAYALFTGGDGAHCELLIGGGGFVRARWTTTLPGAAALLAQVQRLAALPMAARPVHVHAH
jgi:putative copper export protein/mono/diheme cytochrome c family protein